MNTRNKIVTLALVIAVGVAPALAQNTRVVCIASTGALTVREKKCLSTETKATMSNLPQRGTKGTTGPAGQAAIGDRRVERIADDQIIVNTNAPAHVFAFCNDDEVVLSGGCGCIDSGACNTVLSSSGPMPVDPNAGGRYGWRCAMIPTLNSDLDYGSYRAYAICAQAN